MALDFNREADDFDSTFGDFDSDAAERRRKRQDLAQKPKASSSSRPSKSFFTEEVTQDEGRRQRFQLLSLNAYDRHKKLVNDYVLYFKGATNLMQRDTSRDKRDIDVIRENHQFLWEENDKSTADWSWGKKLAKKYYEKLFKEYCICDVTKYKENQVGMRWRTEAEVSEGKGQFVCGTRKCEERHKLRTWEVNFAYAEKGEKKNALIKVRLCPGCSYKLNYHHKRKEVTKHKKKKTKKRRKDSDSSDNDDGGDSEEDKATKEKLRKFDEEKDEKQLEKQASDVWSAPVQVEQEKSREEDFSQYLEDLFL